jgi:DNA-binding response OmpR family regulator
MTTPRILIAEDDDRIREGLIDTLESEGFEAMAVGNGAEAIETFRREGADLILLDVMMPEKSGFDVCKEIRKDNERVPIIMLTAKGEEIDKVVGLKMGADDYVTKPFGVHELLARVNAVLRRSRIAAESPEGDDLPEEFDFGPARVNRKTFRSRLGETDYDLTAREVKLLELFVRRPSEVLSRNDLLNAVWGIDYMGTTRTLNQHIAQLRKKSNPTPPRRPPSPPSTESDTATNRSRRPRRTLRLAMDRGLRRRNSRRPRKALSSHLRKLRRARRHDRQWFCLSNSYSPR